jgi:4-hydroxy-tetrahydrodipicolinate synthase
MRGIYTALVTPFDAQGEIDFGSLTKILNQQVGAGIKGFVVCGTTGESPTLSKEEKEKLFRFVFDFSKGKDLDLVAGTGTNDTRESIRLTRIAALIGFRQFLAVVPYYNRPSQAGLRAHFEAIGDSISEGTVVLYNVPSRTGVSLSVETIVALAAHPRIHAIKEASGDLKFFSDLRAALAGARKDLQFLSGDDATYSSFLAAGGHGVISVASHLCPGGMLEMTTAAEKGYHARVAELQETYLPIFQGIFAESNPGPLKWALSKMGLSENRLRLPLVPVGKSTAEKLGEILSSYRFEAGEYRK